MPARLIGHFRGKARRTLGEGQFEFALLTGVGRKGTGGFRISGELKLTFIGAGAAFLKRAWGFRSHWLAWTCSLLKKSAAGDRNREHNGIKRSHGPKPRGPAIGFASASRPYQWQLRF
jgi:hypothetical protein